MLPSLILRQKTNGSSLRLCFCSGHQSVLLTNIGHKITSPWPPHAVEFFFGLLPLYSYTFWEWGKCCNAFSLATFLPFFFAFYSEQHSSKFFSFKKTALSYSVFHVWRWISCFTWGGRFWSVLHCLHHSRMRKELPLEDKVCMWVLTPPTKGFCQWSSRMSGQHTRWHLMLKGF